MTKRITKKSGKGGSVGGLDLGAVAATGVLLAAQQLHDVVLGKKAKRGGRGKKHGGNGEDDDEVFICRRKKAEDAEEMEDEEAYEPEPEAEPVASAEGQIGTTPGQGGAKHRKKGSKKHTSKRRHGGGLLENLEAMMLKGGEGDDDNLSEVMAPQEGGRRRKKVKGGDSAGDYLAQGGGKKHHKKRHGGDGAAIEGDGEFDLPAIMPESSRPHSVDAMTGGKKKRRSSKKHGGAEELASLDTAFAPLAESSVKQDGGKKRRSKKKHGGAGWEDAAAGSPVETASEAKEVVSGSHDGVAHNEDYASVGGRRKRTTHRRKHRGGEGDGDALPDITSPEAVPAPADPLQSTPQNAEAKALDAELTGGKGKRKSGSKKRKGGALYESQMGGLQSILAALKQF